MSANRSIKRYIVFTDLDGTLLDHENYTWDAARPALDALRDKNIPVVLASSKTAAEIFPLREEMGLAEYEAIVENGAGILRVGDMVSSSDRLHVRILKELEKLPAELSSQFSNFASWSAQEVASKTGLTLEDAKRAQRRQYSEPGLWMGTPEQFFEFSRALLNRGIFTQQGGRFISLSFGGNKKQRMIEIMRELLNEQSTRSIALGDAPNDIAMIEAADFGIIVSNPSHNGVPQLLGEADGIIQRSTLVGPAGWNEMILKLLDQLKG